MALVGTCEKMCPAHELATRTKQKRLHVFEMPSNDPKNLAVKEFLRSAAGKEVNTVDLRPAYVLLETVNYLLGEIVDRHDQPWSVVYQFVFDRIRAVRQDMVIQRIVDKTAVEILEKAVRFHILAGYKLCGSDLRVFDQKINDVHVLECLKRLLVLYEEQPNLPNRAEFESFYLLWHLCTIEALMHGISLPEEVKTQASYLLTWRISLAALCNNFVAFFRLVRELPYLASCLVHRHFSVIRCKALTVMSTAYSNPKCQFPLSNVSAILAFSNLQETVECLGFYGIEVSNGLIKFSKKSFISPEKPPVMSHCSFIDCKHTGSIRNILRGTYITSVHSLYQAALPDRAHILPDCPYVDKDSNAKQYPCERTISAECSQEENKWNVEKQDPIVPILACVSLGRGRWALGKGRGVGRGWGRGSKFGVI